MPGNARPISKRSRRLLEEANRHINYARRGIEHLSIQEYWLLHVAYNKVDTQTSFPAVMNKLILLSEAINCNLAERSQP